jgi:hypothetical protein
MEMKTGINFMTNLSLVVIYLTCGQISSGGEEMLPRVASLGVLFGHKGSPKVVSGPKQTDSLAGMPLHV